MEYINQETELTKEENEMIESFPSGLKHLVVKLRKKLSSCNIRINDFEKRVNYLEDMHLKIENIFDTIKQYDNDLGQRISDAEDEWELDYNPQKILKPRVKSMEIEHTQTHENNKIDNKEPLKTSTNRCMLCVFWAFIDYKNHDRNPIYKCLCRRSPLYKVETSYTQSCPFFCLSTSGNDIKNHNLLQEKKEIKTIQFENLLTGYRENTNIGE